MMDGGYYTPRRSKSEEDLDETEIALGITSRGEVKYLKNVHDGGTMKISPEQMVDICCQFIADSCMKQISGGPFKLSMFKDGMALDVKEVLIKYLDKNYIDKKKGVF